MSKRENDGEISGPSKQQKTNKVNQNRISFENVSNQVSSPAIFKLNAICFDDLFEWLSLKDLISLSRTCKRMLRLTGIYFQENFKSTVNGLNRTISCSNGQRSIIINAFIQFIPNIVLREFCKEHILTDFHYFGANCDSLREISIHGVNLSKAMVNCIQAKLDKIETINIRSLELEPTMQLYSNLLKFCSLKSLFIECDDTLDREWMCHKYPKIEKLKLIYYGGEALSPNLGLFFQLNSFKTFETDDYFLLRNEDIIMNSEMKLDTLNIHYTEEHFDDVCDLLNELHEHGFYKRLEFGSVYHYLSEAQIHQICTLGGLKKLFIKLGDIDIVFPTLISLRELFIKFNSIPNFYNYNNYNLLNVKSFTISFQNLQKIHLCSGVRDHLLTCIRMLPNLKKVICEHLERIPTDTIEGNQIDLPTLNRERKKLAGACKVTIYVDEEVYLETKDIKSYIYSHYDLIEMRRISAL